MDSDLIAKELSQSIIGAFYEVYNFLGYGFLEHVYAAAMQRELRLRGHSVECEKLAPVFYKDAELCLYRIDMVVDDTIVLETKSSERLPLTALRQLRNYLKATKFEVGLLLHFGPELKFYRQVLSNERKVARQNGLPLELTKNKESVVPSLIRNRP
jgi:GxxExxY protein